MVAGAHQVVVAAVVGHQTVVAVVAVAGVAEEEGKGEVRHQRTAAVGDWAAQKQLALALAAAAAAVVS